MNDIGIVFVVDDDPSMCDLIQSALQRAGLAVKTFSSVETFVAADPKSVAGTLPCCLLLDVVMPGTSGLEFLEKHLAQGDPAERCPVIMITGRGSVRTAVQSMKLGAVDFLEKPFATETLTALVLDTLQKHKSSQSLREQREEVRSRVSILSPRERELLHAIVLGRSTKMIADGLGISSRTVDHHRANLMEKMKAANVADLVRMAVQADYLNVKRADGAVDDPAVS
jgi:two-component system response regulator FixJ